MADIPVRKRHGRPLLYDFLVETFAVVLGITVALAATAWQTARSERAQAAAARASIVEELQANRAEVSRSHAYHGRLIEAIRPRMGAGQSGPGIGAFNEGFIRPADLLTTAWDVAGATGGLALMEYDEVLAFSRLYAHQERYEESSALSGRIIYERLFEEGAPRIAENYRNLFGLISAAYYLEEGLLAEYAEVLEE